MYPIQRHSAEQGCDRVTNVGIKTREPGTQGSQHTRCDRNKREWRFVKALRAATWEGEHAVVYEGEALKSQMITSSFQGRKWMFGLDRCPGQQLTHLPHRPILPIIDQPHGLFYLIHWLLILFILRSLQNSHYRQALAFNSLISSNTLLILRPPVPSPSIQNAGCPAGLG
jgi:hypothetical protein